MVPLRVLLAARVNEPEHVRTPWVDLALHELLVFPEERSLLAPPNGRRVAPWVRDGAVYRWGAMLSLTQGQRQQQSSRVGHATRSVQRRFTAVNRARMKSRRVARRHSAHHVYARKSLRLFWLGRKSLNGTPSPGMEHPAGVSPSVTQAPK